MRCRYPIQASLLFLASSGLQLAACTSEEPVGGGTSTVSGVAGTSAPTAAAGTSAAGRTATPAAGTSAPVAGATTPSGAAGRSAAGTSAAGTSAAGTGVAGSSGALASAGASGLGSAGSTGGTSAAGTSAAGGAGGSAAAVTYQKVFEEVFVAGSCGVAACHANAQGPSKLGLSDADTAYTELVGVKAMADCASSGVLRVKAGDPDNSLLLQKLEDKQTCGAPMPPNGLLDAAQVQLVRSWILAGAKK